MMEGDVVKKNAHSWLWVVIALLIVAALYFLGASDTGTHNQIYRGGQRLGAVDSLTHT